VNAESLDELWYFTCSPLPRPGAHATETKTCL